MYCKKCGTEIDDDSIVCKVCGTPTGVGNLENRVAKKKTKLPIIIIVVALILAGVGGYFFIQSKNKSSLSTEEKYIVGQWKMTVDYPSYSDKYTLKVYSDHTGDVVYTSNTNKVYATLTWTYVEEDDENEKEDSSDYISYDIVMTIGNEEANGSIQYFEETDDSDESINLIYLSDNDSGIWIFEDKTSL